MTAQHTPGPWSIEWKMVWCDEAGDCIPGNEYAEHIRAHGDGEMYQRYSVCGTCDGCNLIRAPDARLIAAAPELLAALVALLEDQRDASLPVLAQARAAIEKATGKTK